MRPRLRDCALLAIGLVAIGVLTVVSIPGNAVGEPSSTRLEPHRSPVSLAISADGTRLLTANQSSGSVSLVDPAAGTVLHEIPTGDKPAGVAISRDGKRGVVSHWFGYDLAVLSIEGDRLTIVGRVEVGAEPRGVALSDDGKTAYVAIGARNEVARVDVDALKVTGRLTVGREPRGIALTPDGKKLVVANARSKTVSIISTTGWKVERTRFMEGDNLRQVAVDAKGEFGYVANMKNRGFATTKNNIDIGWVLGQRLTRVAIEDTSDSFETISLDAQGMAAGDAHGVALSGDGRYVAVGLGGTHEVFVFSEADRPLPWRSNGSRDLIEPSLARDRTRFRRVALGGRPTELAFGPDHKTLYVANFLSDSVQVIDASLGTVRGTIQLGGPSEPSLERRGEAIFHDASRSFNQWYSCNTCHGDGHTGGGDYDTLNDGWQDLSQTHLMSRKKVPSLRRVAQTGPWTWHGWQEKLEDAMVESFTKSMQGKRPSDDDVEALIAYLKTLDYPRNPNLGPDGALSPAAERGKLVYRSPKAACNTCHGGVEMTDGKVHSVGLEFSRDVYKGYNPPSLRGVYDKDPYLHDGRAKTLQEVLLKDHNPDEVNGLGALDETELNDLIEYLKSL